MKRTTAGLLLALSAAFATQAAESDSAPLNSTFSSKFLYALTNNRSASQRSHNVALMNMPDYIRSQHLKYSTGSFATKAETTTPTADPKDIQHASGLHLAYIITPSAASNDMAKRGLEALAIALLERTSVEPKGVVGLNIERDDISLFPILYWPVTKETQPLSEAAELRVNRYLARGGVIIFDSRDDAAVARLVNGLSVGHLVEAGPDHSLTRSFYLVSSLEGTNNSKPVLIQSPRTSSENVTQVIVGSRNWAGAWSGTTLGPASREREMALRAGINMVMFALTGMYKEDQIHMKSILEKLGKPAPKQ